MRDNVSPEWAYVLSEDATPKIREVAEQLQQGATPFAISAALRKTNIPTEFIAPVLTQAELQRKAVTKFGEHATAFRFTPAGLEQATRHVVAQQHAARYTSAGIHTVTDLGCGIGAESLAFMTAGLSAQPVEIDPITASVAQFNLDVMAELHGAAAVSVHTGAAEEFSVGSRSGVFLDPARRTAGQRGTRRIASPEDYSPSLTFAYGLAEHHATGVKLGPGLDRELIPDDAEAQWVSVDRQVVETGLWFGPLARPGVRRAALVFTGHSSAELTAPNDSEDAPVGSLGTYLYEPDGAVIRARLIGLLSEQISAHMVSDGIAYMTGDRLIETPFATAFRVIETLPANEKQLKKALSQRDVGAVEIKKRGVDVDPAGLRNRLKLRGSQSATIVMTRLAGKHTTLLVERAQPTKS